MMSRRIDIKNDEKEYLEYLRNNFIIGWWVTTITRLKGNKFGLTVNIYQPQTSFQRIYS